MDALTTPVGFGVAFAAGLLSFLSPCVLPLVPAYLGYIAGTTIGPDEEMTGKRAAALVHALFFVLGFGLLFTALGASMGLFGAALTRHTVLLQRVGGIILVVLGLHALHLITIPGLNRGFNIDASGLLAKPAGHLRSALIGGVFAIGWTPCVGVILSGILALAATSSTALQGAGLLAAYSLGLGVPFILSALALGRARGVLRRLNRHSQLVQKTSGGLLVVMGLIVFTNVLGIVSAYFSRWFGTFL